MNLPNSMKVYSQTTVHNVVCFISRSEAIDVNSNIQELDFSVS